METPIIFNNFRCTLLKNKYRNGRLALMLMDQESGEPVVKATVNLPTVELDEDHVIIDPKHVGLVEALQQAEIIDDNIVRHHKSGYVEYPEYELHPRFILDEL